jgi:hypothetical protein
MSADPAAVPTGTVDSAATRSPGSSTRSSDSAATRTNPRSAFPSLDAPRDRAHPGAGESPMRHRGWHTRALWAPPRVPPRRRTGDTSAACGTCTGSAGPVTTRSVARAFTPAAVARCGPASDPDALPPVPGPPLGSNDGSGTGHGRALDSVLGTWTRTRGLRTPLRESAPDSGDPGSGHALHRTPGCELQGTSESPAFRYLIGRIAHAVWRPAEASVRRVAQGLPIAETATEGSAGTNSR